MEKFLAGLIGHGMLAAGLVGCGNLGGNIEIPKANTVESAGAAIVDQETAGQIKAMPPCRATLETRQPCYAIFRTADGKRFAIGSPAASSEVVRFLGTLHGGESYAFPGVFVDYLKSREKR